MTVTYLYDNTQLKFDIKLYPNQVKLGTFLMFNDMQQIREINACQEKLFAEYILEIHLQASKNKFLLILLPPPELLHNKHKGQAAKSQYISSLIFLLKSPKGGQIGLK